MSQVIALRPVEFEVETDRAVSEMSTCMMQPVFALAEAVKAQFEAEGLPKWRAVRVTVYVSEQLRAALDEEGAFDLIVKYDDEIQSR